MPLFVWLLVGLMAGGIAGATTTQLRTPSTVEQRPDLQGQISSLQSSLNDAEDQLEHVALELERSERDRKRVAKHLAAMTQLLAATLLPIAATAVEAKPKRATRPKPKARRMASPIRTARAAGCVR